MKHVSLLVMLLLSSTAVHANKYETCQNWCKQQFASDVSSTQLYKESCKTGCSYSHWSGNEKGVARCRENIELIKMDTVTCVQGANQYGK